MQFVGQIHRNQGLLTARSHQRSAQQGNLAHAETYSLEAVAGLEVRATSGVLWLTQQGEGRDIMLRAGQSWTASRAGHIVIQAIGGDATWMMSATEAAKKPRWLRAIGLA